jgi:hypothetical protein
VVLAAVGGTASVASDCQSITLTATTPAAANAAVTISVDPSLVAAALRKPLLAQTFGSNTTVTYTAGIGAGQTAVFSNSAGAWTYNGFTTFINYMPYGSNITQIIYAANRGSNTGAITVSARNTAGTACSFSAGTLLGNRVTQLSGTIKGGLEACYGVGFTDKVSMTVSAVVPATNVQIYSAYNVNGTDRGTVNNWSGVQP